MSERDGSDFSNQKSQQLISIYQAVEKDQQAPLYPHRTAQGYRTVYSETWANAKIMIIGAAPTAQEAISGRSFIGPSGFLLHDLLRLHQIDRKRVYLTHLVKDCLPDHRSPSSAEITYYAQYLQQEFEILRPRLIVPIGCQVWSFILQHFQANYPTHQVCELHGGLFEGQSAFEAITIVPIIEPFAALESPIALLTLALDLRVVRLAAQKLALLS